MPPSPRPAGRKAGETYDTLVAATRSIINASGGLTGEMVAEEAGMATATFYAYFSTKEDALAAAFEAVVAEFNACVEPILTIERLLDDGLSNVVAEVVNVMLTNFRTNAAIYRLGLAALSENKRMRLVWRYQELRAAEYLRRFVHYGMNAGKIRPGDADVDAKVLLVLLQGLNNHTMLRLDPDEQVVRRFCAVLEGFLAPPDAH